MLLIVTPEFDSAYMLRILVPIVSRRHQPERGPMLNRQRFTVQAVGQEHGVAQQVCERQARRVAVLTSKNHKCGIQLRTGPGDNDSFEEI